MNIPVGKWIPIVLYTVGVVIVCYLVVVRQRVRQAGPAVLAIAIERLVKNQLARVVVLLAHDARDRVKHALVVDLLLVVDDIVVAHLRASACDGGERNRALALRRV